MLLVKPISEFGVFDTRIRDDKEGFLCFGSSPNESDLLVRDDWKGFEGFLCFKFSPIKDVIAVTFEMRIIDYVGGK